MSALIPRWLRDSLIPSSTVFSLIAESP
jgi:hypothetical protein